MIMSGNTDNLEAGSSLNRLIILCNFDLDSSVDTPIEKQVIWIDTFSFTLLWQHQTLTDTSVD